MTPEQENNITRIHGSLFSGIGGFDLAAEWMGWENVFHCEWMEFPRKVLKYHFPNADSHIDICKTDFTKYANKIDILTGGFPCQPFSLAGKRKGTDDERYLWGEMLRAIQEIKPRFVIAENVFGITNIDGGLVFEQVCLDLEAEGYEVQAFIIPAAAKNAPHRRDRVWFVAQNPLFGRCVHRELEEEGTEIRELGNISTGDSNGICLQKRITTDTNSDGLNQCNRNNEIKPSKGGEYALCDIDKGVNDGTTTNSNSKGLQRSKEFGSINKVWENGNKQSTRCIQPTWKNFPTQSPICGRDDGISRELDGITFSKWRNQSIKAFGNAIVPQIAYELFKVIDYLNNQFKK